MATETKLIYQLDLRIPSRSKERINIDWSSFTVGSDHSADLCLEELGVAPLQFKLRFTEDILSITNLGGDGATKIGRQALNQGRMYIIDKGDKITFGEKFKCKIIIRREKIKVEIEEEFEDEIEEEIEDQEIEDDVEFNDSEVDEQTENDIDTDDKTDPGLSPLKDDSEDEEQTSTGLTARIKNIMASRRSGERGEVKASAPKIDTKNKSKKKLLKGKKIGFLVRTMAFLFNLSLVLNLYFYILPLAGKKQIVSEKIALITSKLFPYIEKGISLGKVYIPEKFWPQIEIIKHTVTLEILILAFTISFLSHLIFGKSIGLFIAGVREESKFIVVRIKAIMRMLFSIITTPFIIFDIPAIFSRRTLKEVLSFSYLTYRNNLFRFTGVITLVVLTFALYTLPLIDYIEELQTEKDISSLTLPKGKKKVESEAVNYFSSYFGLKGKSYFSQNWNMISTLTGKKKAISPTLLFLEDKKEQTVKISKLDSISFENEIKQFAETDLFFGMTYPFLKDIDNQKLIDVNLSFNELVTKLLSLSFFNLHEFVMSHGVFLHNYLELRKTILNKLKISPNQILSITSIRGKHYITAEDKAANMITVYDLNGVVFNAFQMKGSKKSSSFLSKVLHHLFLPSSPIKSGEVVDLNKLDKFDSFNVIDAYAAYAEFKDLKPSIIKKINHYYLSLAYKFKQSDNEAGKKELVDSIKLFDKTINSLDKEWLSENIIELRQSLLRLQKAILESDQAFFEMNKVN